MNLLISCSPKIESYLIKSFEKAVNLLNAITAGIAANKPNAVAINASEIPGATAFIVA